MSTRETPTHSPSPWTTDGYGVYDADGRLIAELSDDGVHTEANGRIILKAPELLAACRKHLLVCEMYGVESLDYPTMKALVDHIDGGGE